MVLCIHYDHLLFVYVIM